MINIKTPQTATPITVTNSLSFNMLWCGSFIIELFSALDIILIVTNGLFVVVVVMADADNCDKLAGSKRMRHQA